MAQEIQKIYSLYCITNIVNNKVYIGQTIALKQRWYDHKRAAKNNPNQIIHHAMIKYGIENFMFESITSCKTQDDANEVEVLLIIQYESHISMGKGYNVSNGGNNASKTEDWKRKVSNKLMGHKVSQETREKVSKGNTGKIRSDKFKNDVGDFWRGKERSEEHRTNLSESLKGNKNCLGKKNGLGYRHTPEALEKIRQATIKRMSNIKGKTLKVIDGKKVWIDKSNDSIIEND